MHILFTREEGTMKRRIHLDCAGRTARELLDQLRREIVPSSDGSGIVLVVENLGRVEDSLTAVFKKLFSFIRDRGINASIIDQSGYMALFRQSFGSPPTTYL